MTHQEIADAFETIYARSREITAKEREWLGVEQARLRAACACVGHIYGQNRWSVISLGGRVCQVCGEPEAAA